MLFEYVATNATPLFQAASFTGGVAVFYLVMQRTRRKRFEEKGVS